jgi:hypothetical protein
MYYSPNFMPQPWFFQFLFLCYCTFQYYLIPISFSHFTHQHTTHFTISNRIYNMNPESIESIGDFICDILIFLIVITLLLRCLLHIMHAV